MKLAFSSNAFRKYSIEETISILSDIGYDGVELMGDRPHLWPPEMNQERVRSIRQALQDHRMQISNVNAFMMCGYREPRTGRPGTFHWPSWIDRDEDLREARIAHTIGCVEYGAALGARTISTEPGGPLGDFSREEAYRLFARGLKRVARRAVDLGVELLIEPEPDLLIERSGEFEEFFEKYIDFRGVGLNFDMGHFFCVGEEPDQLIRTLGRRAAHFHLEDIAESRVHFHLPPGEGAMDFSRIFEGLREIDYGGWVTIELYPFQENAPSIAEKAFHYINTFR